MNAQFYRSTAICTTQTRGMVDRCPRSLWWVVYGLLNKKAARYVGNIIGVAMDLTIVLGILIHAGWTY